MSSNLFQVKMLLAFLKMLCFLLIVVSAVPACKDSVLSPGPSPAVQHYRLYAGNWGYDQVFVVDTDSNNVVDTLRGFGSVWDLTTTHSGKKLYVATRQGPVNYAGGIYVVDLLTKTTKQVLAQSSDVYIAPNGTPLVIVSTPYDTLRQVGTIDTVSDAISFFDTLDVRDGGSNYQAVALHSTEPILYTMNNQNNVVAYNYARKELVHHYKSIGPVVHAVISKDNTKLFCTVYQYTLVVLDLVHDTVLVTGHANHLGTLALSPAGEYVYVTDPGQYLSPGSASGRIGIYSASTASPVGFIDVNGASGQPHTGTDRIVITTDGDKAYVSTGYADIFILSLRASSVTHTMKVFPSNTFIRPLALGMAVK